MRKFLTALALSTCLVTPAFACDDDTPTLDQFKAFTEQNNITVLKEFKGAEAVAIEVQHAIDLGMSEEELKQLPAIDAIEALVPVGSDGSRVLLDAFDSDGCYVGKSGLSREDFNSLDARTSAQAK